jgi:hypothetical protein
MKPAMRTLRLDYQRPAFGYQWPGLVLLFSGLLLCALLFQQSFSISSELMLTEQHVFKLKREAERRRLLVSSERSAEEGGQDEKRRASPSAARWEALLSALERTSDDSVTLLGLEPGAREMTLIGEARTLGAALDYVKRLQVLPQFADIHLTRHEIVNEHPYRPVRFTLQTTWREALQ